MHRPQPLDADPRLNLLNLQGHTEELAIGIRKGRQQPVANFGFIIVDALGWVPGSQIAGRGQWPFRIIRCHLTEQHRVFEHRQQGAPGEVVTETVGILAQAAEDAQRLTIALEAAELQHVVVEDLLAVVAEGRMADVVGQTGGFDQVLGRHPRRQRLHPFALAKPGQAVGQ